MSKKDWYIVIRDNQQRDIAIQFFKIVRPQLIIPNIAHEKFILIINQNDNFDIAVGPDPNITKNVIEKNIFNVSNPFFISFSNEKNCDVTLQTINSYIHCVYKNWLPHENLDGTITWRKKVCA